MRKTGIEDYYVIKNDKKLRFGYTTGSCAAAASKAAAIMLLRGEIVEYVKLVTPKGIELLLETVNPCIDTDKGEASCGIRKDSGDDPDVTDGLVIYSTVSETVSGFLVDGGEGVGRVSCPGLEQPEGNAAINSTPRRMIVKELEEAAGAANAQGYTGGLKAVISVPGGAETAKKTFNPRLGIKDGISILGTTGIVEPMSESALIKSIEVELRQRAAMGQRKLLITLGNYGSDYSEEFLEGRGSGIRPLKCSNFIGETIDMAVNEGFEEIAFIAHIGKFVKVAGGIMNTHSRNADARAEIMAAAALRCGIDRDGAMRILDSLTTDDALDILDEYGLADPACRVLAEKIHYYLNIRSRGRLKTGAMIFSNKRGYLSETEEFRDILESLTKA